MVIHKGNVTIFTPFKSLFHKAFRDHQIWPSGEWNCTMKIGSQVHDEWLREKISLTHKLTIEKSFLGKDGRILQVTFVDKVKTRVKTHLKPPPVCVYKCSRLLL